MVIDKLIKLGINPKYKGIYYTEWILTHFNSATLTNICRIYQKTAVRFNTSYGAVEHAIRTLRQNTEDYKNITNKEFIHLLKIKIKPEKLKIK